MKQRPSAKSAVALTTEDVGVVETLEGDLHVICMAFSFPFLEFQLFLTTTVIQKKEGSGMKEDSNCSPESMLFSFSFQEDVSRSPAGFAK